MESLQQLIIDTLERDGKIADTRAVKLPPALHKDDVQEAQMVIQGHRTIRTKRNTQNRKMIEYTTQEVMGTGLTPEGAQIAELGSHEARVWSALPTKGSGPALSIPELKKIVGDESAKIGQGRAPTIIDTTQNELKEIQSTGTLAAGDKSINELKKRKLVVQRKGLWFTVTKGSNFSTSIAKPETDLTYDMLQTGVWKNSTFKQYNFEAEGTPTGGGALHPLLKVREEFRNIFFEMGYEISPKEMPTSQFVESGFWNFDTLFVPQQHPARDLQDTFYLSDPAESHPPPKDYYETVARTHEHGGFGSIGYRAPWREADSRRLLLRTHTTATSARMLKAVADREGGFKPIKMFSIDRVFRNEAVDATHLAEFHQVEGLVADRGITLGDLIGFMQTFFKKMGVDNLRFKPAYNPYTEPSLEIFAFHKGLNRWVEIGNSGMFRPEMLEPMGLPPDVRVLGWGLSLERPTMIRYGISNIRALVGHKVSIESVERSAAVRF
ncbi:phenylalanine-tRNA ligase [Rhizoctonia solani AG-1 IA]|uniref:phenylalanine--tRNA ligase n=1 Tax=Thanatephorus cucumeris (strain AG1-IA) TaxID=983506 RepID=L8X9H5_THACA|nr:phenylalanine-tRNA ligase [Rhizoctonia solani AG-1 IA]